MPSESILVVDDEANIRRSLRRVFEGDGYVVHEATDGEDGLARMAEHRPPIVISDYAMPGMNGLQFFERIMPEYPDTIRILLTGQADLQMAIAAINHGSIYKFLLKPWNNDALKVAVRRALEQAALQAENRDLTAKLRDRDALLHSLEQAHPGITDRPADGIYRIG